MRLSLLLLLVSSFLPAATVTGTVLRLDSLASFASPLETGALSLADGWTVYGRLLLNQTVGNAVNSPITLTLTDTEIVCENETVGCSASFLSFSATIDFNDTFSGPTPYTVEISGTGPNSNAFISFNGGAGSGFAFLAAGNYSFSESGSWNAEGSNSSLLIEGGLGLAAAPFRTTISFPNSFHIAVSPAFTAVPEPSTAGLALLGSLGLAWAFRRRR